MSNERSPTLAQVLRAAIDQALDDVHVMLPGRVEKYDAASQTASVKPVLKRRLKLQGDSELVEALPVIPRVPIVFPRAGGFFVSFPIAPGDFVMLVFSERSLDKWLQGNGGDTDPDDFRRHDLSDAVAIPGLYPNSAALSDAHAANMALGKDAGGPQIHFDGTNVHLGAYPAADFLAKATPTESRLAALENAIATHVHGGVMPGPSSVAPSGLVLTGDPVATTTAKGS
jgi:hypothetical protein